MDDISKVDSNGVLVEILLPKYWFNKPYYKLLKQISIAEIDVPLHFRTDGATSPRFLWPIFPPIGKYFKATVVHDFLLQTGYDRKYADDIFLKALTELGIEGWRKNSMYYAVRMYGIFINIIS